MEQPRDLLDGRKPSDYFYDERDNICQVNELSGSQFRRAGLTAIHAVRRRIGTELTSTQTRCATYIATVYLADHPEPEDIWKDGRHTTLPQMQAGAISLYDMRHLWLGDNRAPFNTLNFFIPQSAFDESTRELGAVQLSALSFDVESGCRDDVMVSLARAILPALARPHEMNALFADHVFAAVRIHLLRTYGGFTLDADRFRVGLTAEQKHRVKELLLDDLETDHSVAELADTCGLSSHRFTRAFKRTFGDPPHRWLIGQRVARAKQLLHTRHALSDIALSCGFADQSHFTRVFTRAVGTSPAAWRRETR